VYVAIELAIVTSQNQTFICSKCKSFVS